MNRELAGTTDESARRTEPDEPDLIRRIVGGERRLYGALVERYQRRLYYAALRLVGDPDTADDIVQEAFVRAYRHLPEYDPAYRFYTWIYRIARNRALNEIRRRKTWGTVSLSDETAPALSADADPSRRTERSELAAALEACRETLPADQREVFDLRHAEEMTYDEIAAAAEIPAGTVMSRLHRAREKMRRCLEGKGVSWGA